MKKLIDKYENKFNDNESKVKVDESWNRYFDDEKSISYKRYKYCISKLFGEVIDVGSGDGFGAYLMMKNQKIINVNCIEIQDKAIEISKNNLKDFKNINIIKGIGEELDFVDNYFDTAYCGETLEHAFDDNKIISEIHRVVKKLAIFTVPINGGINLQHVREYKNCDEIKNKLSKYFDIIEYRVFNDKQKNIKRIAFVCKK
jgi:ubiquinone/menaquinone biosynthesis C-methylase UbiE